MNRLRVLATYPCAYTQVGWWKGWRISAIYLFVCSTFRGSSVTCKEHAAFSVCGRKFPHIGCNQTQQTILHDHCGDRRFAGSVYRVLLFCVSDPKEAAHQCVILWQQTFLNTEFLFCLTTYVCHLSPLFRYACVRLDAWDTLIRKLSQQLSDKITSICATGRSSVGTCSCGA